MRVVKSVVPQYVWDYLKENKGLSLEGSMGTIMHYNSVNPNGIKAWLRNEDNQLIFAQAYLKINEIEVENLELPNYPTDYFESPTFADNDRVNEQVKMVVEELLEGDNAYVVNLVGGTLIVGVIDCKGDIDIYVANESKHASIVDGKIFK